MDTTFLLYIILNNFCVTIVTFTYFIQSIEYYNLYSYIVSDKTYRIERPLPICLRRPFSTNRRNTLPLVA